MQLDLHPQVILDGEVASGLEYCMPFSSFLFIVLRMKDTQVGRGELGVFAGAHVDGRAITCNDAESLELRGGRTYGRRGRGTGLLRGKFRVANDQSILVSIT